MIIDTHTHIMTLSIMGRNYTAAKMVDGYKAALDYADFGPTDEMWNQMLENWKNIHLDEMGAMFLQAKTEAGIDKAIVFHVDVAQADTEMGYEEINRWFANLARNNPDRIISFAGIDPARGDEGIKFLEKCVKEWGMKGLKLHPTACEFYINDRKIYPYYKKAEELGIPILFHTGPGGPQRLAYSNPLLLDEVAADFADLKIIIAHLQDPWLSECLSIVQWRPNVYLDISGGQTMYKVDPERFYRTMKTILRTSVRKRILFATDTFSPLGWVLSDKEWIEVIKGIPVSEYAPHIPVDPGVITDLMAGNASRLLGLS
jgi:uncharacterized protein